MSTDQISSERQSPGVATEPRRGSAAATEPRRASAAAIEPRLSPVSVRCRPDAATDPRRWFVVSGTIGTARGPPTPGMVCTPGGGGKVGQQAAPPAGSTADAAAARVPALCARARRSREKVRSVPEMSSTSPRPSASQFSAFILGSGNASMLLWFCVVPPGTAAGSAGCAACALVGSKQTLYRVVPMEQGSNRAAPWQLDTCNVGCWNGS